MKKSAIRIGVAVGAACCMVFFCSSCSKAGKEYDEAMQLMEEGKYDDSVRHFQKAISENNENAEYYIGYGMALNSLGRYEEAIKEFDKVYQDTDNKISEQNNKKMYFGHAAAYYGMNEYNKALEACNKALGIAQYEYMDKNLKCIKAASEQLLGNADKAIETYSEIIKEDDKDADIYIKRGRLYDVEGKAKEAADDYNKAIELDKSCYDAYFELYNVYVKMEQNSKAEDILKNLTDIKADSADKLLQQGRAYYYLGDYSAALNSLRKAEEEKNKESDYYLGLVYMAQSDYQGAVACFQKYIDNKGSGMLSETYNQIAGCYIELEEYDKAADYLDKGINCGEIKASRMLKKNMVILYERMKQYKKARSLAKSYLTEFPDDSDMQKELEFIKTRIKTIQLAK